MLCDKCTRDCTFRGDDRLYCFFFKGKFVLPDEPFEERAECFALEYQNICHKYHCHLSEDEMDSNASYLKIQDNYKYQSVDLVDSININDNEVF